MDKKTKKPIRPWINPDGSKKSDEEISRLGQGWDKKTWRRFLDDDVGKLTDDGRLAGGTDPDEFSDEEYKTAKRKLSHGIADLDLQAVFETASEGLAPRESEILKRYFWEGATLQEIAQESGISPGTVRSAKKRGLDKMRKVLASEDFKTKLSVTLKRRSKEKRKKEERNVPTEQKVSEFVRECLHRLPPSERAVVDCLYLKKMPFVNTATATGKTVGEVGAIRKSAFGRLKKIYRDGYEKNRTNNNTEENP